MASSFSDRDVRQDSAISSHQLAAVSAPGCRTTDLLGSFGDVFEQQRIRHRRVSRKN